MSIATMPKPKKQAGKAPAASTPRTIALRASAEYAQWVENLAVRNRTTVAGLIDQALASYAKEIGEEQTPPER